MLLELMIIVAIIGLLAVLSVPNFTKARESSQLNICLNNLRIYQDALDTYAFRYQQYPDDINDLMTEGYLKHSYDCPIGDDYAWSVTNANQKYLLRCDGRHTSLINSVCIEENLRPTAK